MHVHTWKLLREEAGRGGGGEGIGSGLVSSGGPFQLNFLPITVLQTDLSPPII